MKTRAVENRSTPMKTEQHGNSRTRSNIHSGMAFVDTSQFNPVDTPKESVRIIHNHLKDTAKFDDCDIDDKEKLRSEKHQNQKDLIKNLSRNTTEKFLLEKDDVKDEKFASLPSQPEQPQLLNAHQETQEQPEMMLTDLSLVQEKPDRHIETAFEGKRSSQ